MENLELERTKAFIEKAESYLNREEYQAALDLAGERLKECSGDLDARVVICLAYVKMGKVDYAHVMLRELEKGLQGLAQVYANLGEISQENGDYQEAIKYYRKFLALSEDVAADNEVSVKLETLLATYGEVPAVAKEDVYEEVETISPDFYTVTMAELYIKQGHLSMAADILAEILKKDTGNAKAFETLNEVKMMMNATLSYEKDLPSRKDSIIAELNLWLSRIDRMRVHAA